MSEDLPLASMQGYRRHSTAKMPNSYGFHHFSPGDSTYPSHPYRYEDIQEESLDLSPLDDFAQKSAGGIALQDFIKPQESGPWSSAHTNVDQSVSQFPNNWSANASYAKSEPGLKRVTFADSTYGTSSTSQFLGPFRDNSSLAEDDADGGSVLSYGRLETSYRLHKRKLTAPCHCGKVPKNPSDARKHALTHEKPFFCQVPGCSRVKGFATDNDLQRHRKTVHDLIPSVGPRTGYICEACPLPESSSRKFWPRRDNFKAHIKRKHTDWDIDRLLDISKQTMRPDDAKSAQTLTESIAAASQIDSFDADHCQIAISPVLGYHAAETYGYNKTSWPSNSAVSLPTDPLTGGMYGYLQFQQPQSSHKETDHETRLLCSDSNHSSYGERAIMPTFSKRQGLDRPLDLNHSHVGTVDFASLSGDYHGDSIAPSLHNLQAAPSVGEHQCPFCSKQKRRDCDLKKHMKRHTRPYGCTFPSCLKTFGSRNDWKRHEGGQHFLQEMWKCQQPCINGERCVRRPFERQESLEKHLRGPDHGMVDNRAIAQACRNYRLGREGHDHFWCGFCEKLIEQKRGEQTAWDERFKHIGDHFDQDGLDGGEWVCIEDNIKKKYIRAGDTKEKRWTTISENELEYE